MSMLNQSRRQLFSTLAGLFGAGVASAAVIKAAPRTKTLVASHWPTPRFIQDIHRELKAGDVVTLDNGHRWECRNITTWEGPWTCSHADVVRSLQGNSWPRPIGSTVNIPLPYPIHSKRSGYGNIEMRRIANRRDPVRTLEHSQARDEGFYQGLLHPIGTTIGAPPWIRQHTSLIREFRNGIDAAYDHAGRAYAIENIQAYAPGGKGRIDAPDLGVESYLVKEHRRRGTLTIQDALRAGYEIA